MHHDNRNGMNNNNWDPSGMVPELHYAILDLPPPTSKPFNPDATIYATIMPKSTTENSVPTVPRRMKK
jgi:hypothetical protein